MDTITNDTGSRLDEKFSASQLSKAATSREGEARFFQEMQRELARDLSVHLELGLERTATRLNDLGLTCELQDLNLDRVDGLGEGSIEIEIVDKTGAGLMNMVIVAILTCRRVMAQPNYSSAIERRPVIKSNHRESKDPAVTVRREILCELAESLKGYIASLETRLQNLGFQFKRDTEYTAGCNSVCFDFRDDQDTMVVAIDLSVLPA